MKLLAIISTYFPNLEELQWNIKTYLPGVDHLIIWENTPKEKSKINIVVEKLNDTKVEVRTTGKNEFLAYPFNKCIEWAQENDFTHILTMDQDSCFEGTGFSEFVNKVGSNTDNSTMVFCPAKTENQLIDSNEIEVDNTITSGTIYKVDVFEKIGYFREDFLIYMIDIEFGMRVKKKGYKILCYPRILLNHFTGYAQKNKLGLRIDNYSAQSTYYIIRNVILNWNLYPDKFNKKEKLTFYKYKIVYRTLKIVFEPQPLKKLKAIYLGLFHGLTGKSGIYKI